MHVHFFVVFANLFLIRWKLAGRESINASQSQERAYETKRFFSFVNMEWWNKIGGRIQGITYDDNYQTTMNSKSSFFCVEPSSLVWYSNKDGIFDAHTNVYVANEREAYKKPTNGRVKAKYTKGALSQWYDLDWKPIAL